MTNWPLDPVETAQALIRCESVTPVEGGALSALEVYANAKDRGRSSDASVQPLADSLNSVNSACPSGGDTLKLPEEGGALTSTLTSL